MLIMPLFFYSTTLIWVDDDGFFVKIVADPFRKDYRVKIFLSPSSFLKFFEEYNATTDNLSFLQKNNGDDDYDVNHRLPVDIDFQTIIDLYHNKGRVNDISAIIVDFKMPKLTGLELMKQIFPSAIKRILLTGEAENELAITAFNDNAIDRFVHKGDSSFAADLRLYVKQMTTQYFCDLTKPLLAHMEVGHRVPQSDPVFIDFLINGHASIT
jgi:CheY-like chemotaxis protein